MNILYIGDIMAEPGIQVIERLLPGLRREYHVDLVVAQAENLSDGKGVRLDDFKRLRAAGVDFCSGGNHILRLPEIYPQLSDPNVPIIRPANYPKGTPGLGHKYADTPKGRVLVVSLLGHIVGKQSDELTDNPLKVIDAILEQEKDTPHVATVVNFHGDFSSEKRIFGYYLDGRVTVAVGDHWHVPTADASVLPKGTAHQSDVGMCGSLDSSLGVRFDSLIPRWRDGKVTRNELETTGRMQLNGLLVAAGENGLAVSATPIQRIY